MTSVKNLSRLRSYAEILGDRTSMYEAERGGARSSTRNTKINLTSSHNPQQPSHFACFTERQSGGPGTAACLSTGATVSHRQEPEADPATRTPSPEWSPQAPGKPECRGFGTGIRVHPTPCGLLREPLFTLKYRHIENCTPSNICETTSIQLICKTPNCPH